MRFYNTFVAAVVAAGLAFAIQPAEAANGLTRKQVKQIRSIVRQELANLPGLGGPAGPVGPPGPSGPPGPPGEDSSGGFEARFAHIFSDGTLDAQHSRGISQENIVVDSVLDPIAGGDDDLLKQFRLVGLPTPLGGQVSIDQGSFLHFDPEDVRLELTPDGASVIFDEHPLLGSSSDGLHVILFY